MKLDADGTITHNPRADQLHLAIRQLIEHGGDYLILSRSDTDYVQTNGVELERRQGDVHVRAVLSRPLDAELAGRVFEAFLDGRAEARNIVAWEPVLARPPRRSSLGGLLTGVVAVAGLLLVYYLLNRN